MKTYVVIPHYLVTEELIQLASNAIDSFRKTSDAIIVSVDDASPIGQDMLKEKSDIYIRNDHNSGFGITCNNGFRHVFGIEDEDCWIVCANNDIEVFKGWESAMKFPFERWENVAITGLISSKCRNIGGTEDGFIAGVPIETYQIKQISEGGQLREWMQSGGLWMSKQSVLKKVGIFDERFLRGGYEDVDLFLRMRDTYGMKIVMSGYSMFWHKEGATRWNCENNGYINNFGIESKAIETENLDRFIQKWGFNPHTRALWRENILLSDI
jgi:hypothetical protein